MVGTAKSPYDGRIDKVIRLVGTSPVSWEDATVNAVAEAALTITDLERARVTELDAVIRDGSAALYRAKIEVAFRLDRSRVVEGGEVIDVRRYLVVGNETLSGPGLIRAVLERLSAGPSEFHVLVPCTPLRDARRWLVYGDPLVGYVDPDAVVTADLDDDAVDRARHRLDDFMHQIGDLDAEASGEVGVANPVEAVQQVLGRSSFDEILLSTLPAGVSRWLRMDLPARLRRVSGLPVTHLESLEP